VAEGEVRVVFEDNDMMGKRLSEESGGRGVERGGVDEEVQGKLCAQVLARSQALGALGLQGGCEPSSVYRSDLCVAVVIWWTRITIVRLVGCRAA
jgi:hypothetical protein